MKKITKILTISLMIILGSLSTRASVVVIPSDSTTDAAIASKMMLRLNEIQTMDKTTLSTSDKKELRKELNKMKKQAGDLDKKVYLSVGAIIIIILLLILILR